MYRIKICNVVLGKKKEKILSYIYYFSIFFKKPEQWKMHSVYRGSLLLHNFKTASVIGFVFKFVL